MNKLSKTKERLLIAEMRELEQFYQRAVDAGLTLSREQVKEVFGDRFNNYEGRHRTVPKEICAVVYRNRDDMVRILRKQDAAMQMYRHTMKMKKQGEQEGASKDV